MDQSREPGNEFAFINEVRKRLQLPDSVIVGPGDDCAIVRPGDSDLVLKVDSVLEGTHFQRSDPEALGYARPNQIGFKVMARTISDFAAMGATPAFALVSTALPQGEPSDLRHGLVEGLLAAASPWKVALVGGDTKSWNDSSACLTLSVSVAGFMEGRRPVLRSGARAGDTIFVTGALGGSIFGRHLSPQPRVKEGQWLSDFGASAMIDLSDGLSGDLWQICVESGVGARLQAEAIPIHDDALRFNDGLELEYALHDGEDFELLFTIPPALAAKLSSDWPFDLRLTRIGEILGRDQGLQLKNVDGASKPLEIKGYEHRF